MDLSTLHILGFATPIGFIVLTEERGAIASIDWRPASCPAPSSDNAVLRKARTELERYFAGSLTAFDVPCAPHGTAFQKRVWAELRRVPFGATVTYGELARRVGSSARAVGGACGANPIPIIVPCHRVVAADGGAGGYSGLGGLKTKAKLLELETRRGTLPLKTHAAS